MKRVFKWVGYGLIALLSLVALALVVVVFISTSRADRHYHVPAVSVAVPTDAASIAEGHRLFRARACAECHGEDGAGKVMVDATGLGRFVSANITYVAKRWSPKDFDRAIRHGVSPQGRPYLVMPAHDFWPMPDTELGDIIAFIRTLPRVQKTLPPSHVGILGHVLHVTHMLPLYPAELVHQHARRPVIHPGMRAYGAYIGRSCTGCHGDHLSGGRVPGAPVAKVGIPPNLTPGSKGLGAWTEADFKRLIRTGVAKNGKHVNPEHMPYPVYRYMSDAEIHDLWGYLHSLPPRPFGGR